MIHIDIGRLLDLLGNIETLMQRRQAQTAIDNARALLTEIDRLQLSPLNSELAFPALPCSHSSRSEAFRQEWQKLCEIPLSEGTLSAAFKLLRWRLSLILGDLTGDVDSYYEAALARPDLPVSQAALGCALARAGKHVQALPHLHYAVTGDPVDRQAARAYFGVLGLLGMRDEQRRFAREQRLLVKREPERVACEDWFEKAPPVGDELASIIILCCNQMEYTQLCVDSVLRHTRQPFELILVDNGSTDGTAECLGRIADCRFEIADLNTNQTQEQKQEATESVHNPERVVVIRNETNLGFAAGCNQGLKEARGEYLVLLNNDTVVTENWLEGLIKLLLFDWPHTGMVGPVTGYAPVPQFVAPGYQELDGLDSFAERRRRTFAGQAINVERLSGFCLLTRRGVLQDVLNRRDAETQTNDERGMRDAERDKMDLERVLDEGYGLGFFEDDDLCVRVRQAGYRLAVALDVFIHHFGSRTFAGLGIDCKKQLEENFARFKEKRGDEVARPYRMPELASETPDRETGDRETGHRKTGDKETGEPEFPSPCLLSPCLPATTHNAPLTSLCMIVKNEEGKPGRVSGIGGGSVG